MTLTMCPKFSGPIDSDVLGWACTEPKGHEGDHVARAQLDGPVLHRWAQEAPAPTDAPQDHGPLAAPLSDRTLAKVLSRPAYDPPSPTKDAIVEAAIRWYEIRNAHAADVTPLQLFDADDALNMAVKAHHAAVRS